MRSIASEHLCLYLYKSLMVPLFDYGDVIYDCLYQQDSDKLQKLQNAALRIIYRQPGDTPVVEMHRRGNIMCLEDRRHLHVCHQTYKCIHDLAPASISSKLVKVKDRHGIRTRGATEGNLVVPTCRLQMCTRDFCVRGPVNWNVLDSHHKECVTLNSFKTAIYNSGLFGYTK